MPQFCRHNRLLQNCTICSREQEVELRPVVSSSAPQSTQPRAPRKPSARTRAGRPSARGVTVHRVRNSVDDGYRSALAPGLKSTEEAATLADELAFAAGRLRALESDPPGLYAEVADSQQDLEERSWLAFLIAYLGPLETDDPFAAIRAARTSWASGQPPAINEIEIGPRAAYDPDRPERTIAAYRAWASRAGGQSAALAGEPEWTPERRFARALERLSLPGFQRDARFELLVSLGELGAYELRAGTLALGGGDQVTVAAKRALGIGDTMLLERRAAQLAEGCGIPLAALDLGFYNWERGERATVGLGAGAEPDPVLQASVHAALGT
jgi:hypothetical protein